MFFDLYILLIICIASNIISFCSEVIDKNACIASVCKSVNPYCFFNSNNNKLLFSLISSLGNSTDGLEVGIVVAWTLSSNPSDSYLECNGQAVNSTKYPKLYALMHNTPDYRGVFLRGLGGNSASLGVTQGDAIRNITGNFNATDNNSWNINANGVFYGQTIGSGDQGNEGGEYKKYYFDASRVVPVAEENRPINKAVRYFIRAK